MDRNEWNLFLAIHSVFSILSCMERRKNIIFISGIDTYWVRREKSRWKETFRTRLWWENIEEVRIEEVKDWKRIEQDMQSIGLFSSKRLWCFSGWFIKKKRDEEEGTKKKKWEGIEEKILTLLQHLGDDHFVIFSNLLFESDKWILIPWLMIHADVREFWGLWENENWEKRFPELEEKIIKKVLRTYREGESEKEEISSTLADAIGGSLEKLSLIWYSRRISENDIEKSLDLTHAGKIFDLSDAILMKNIPKIRTLFSNILETTTPYELLPVLIGSLRGTLYVKYLQSHGKNERDIGNLIKIHPYPLGKSIRARISYREIAEFSRKLIDANIAYKSGWWMKNPELWRIFAIELAIIGLQKI